MSKVKTKKRDTFIDMTAMSDVTVLLLTFFMLTATFIPIEPIKVVTPASVIEKKLPDGKVFTILIEPNGRVYINLDLPNDKKAALEKMGEKYGVTFSEAEIRNFQEKTTFAGTPMGQMKDYLQNAEVSKQQAYLRNSTGIPVDSANNQLAEWIKIARQVDQDLVIAVKSDQSTPYPKIRAVTSTLQDIKENRFTLVTTLKNMPEGL
ncbi:MAG: biopolymer transporter ExbD [Prevotellaceae bacterium]|jgi:biopolymer transport protein ExbD|nr:biopolymer transporter ExbD [Prevotellaceae bacterium]